MAWSKPRGVPDPLLVHWGHNIKTLRTSKGLSQTEVAELVGVDASNVSRWESGHREPTRTHKARLASALGTLVPVLFPLETEEVA
jgi:transcriptional regulator with XRE-family HTH domain